MNPRLRLAVDKAYEANMPKDNVERAIKRGTGELDGVQLRGDPLRGLWHRRGGGDGGLPDRQQTRTVADVRHAFSKNGGNLGTDGSVAFLFKHCGQFVFAPGTSEDQVMEAAIDAGAEDVVTQRRRQHRGDLPRPATSMR